MNSYLYGVARPTSLIDPTGLFPTEEDVRLEDAVFTCNCGWIDWNHVAKSQEIAFTLIDDLKYANENYYSDPVLNDNWGIRVGIPLGVRGIEFNLFNGLAVIPDGEISRGNIENLATSIFMDANEHFEELQGRWGKYPIPVVAQRLSSSYYSEEDLPSDIIGFYIAVQRHKGVGDYNVLRKRIEEEICKSVGKEGSLEVFSEVYADGNVAINNWRQWRPRLWPSPYLNVCTAGVPCPKPRYWPSQFAKLTAERIYPQHNGIWWWALSRADTGGTMISTGRSNVVRFRSTPYFQDY
jgi:hypothetical protein